MSEYSENVVITSTETTWSNFLESVIKSKTHLLAMFKTEAYGFLHKNQQIWTTSQNVTSPKKMQP